MRAHRKFLLLRLLKLSISGGLFLLAFLWERILSLVGIPPEARCVVLYYHAIPSSCRKKFGRQLDMLVKWTKPIPANFRMPLSPGIHYSAVTFDDGFESFFTNASPELEKRSIPSTVFVVSGSIGRTTGWLGYPEPIMTRDQLLQLPSHLVTIGAHTVTHPALPEVAEDLAVHEIADSRKALEDILQRRISLFSFPYGAFNHALVKICRKMGYERVFTTLPVSAFADPCEFQTGRVWVEPGDWRIEFLLKVFGAYRWLPLAFSLKRKLLGIALARPAVRSGAKADVTTAVM